MVSCFMASKMGEIVANEASEAGTFHPSRLEAGIAAQIKTRKKTHNNKAKSQRKKKCVLCGYRRTHASIPANVGA